MSDDLGVGYQKGIGQMICSWFNFLKQLVDTALPFFYCSDETIPLDMHGVLAGARGETTQGGTKGG